MIPNAKSDFCYFNSSGGLFVGVYIREVFKMNDTEKLIRDLRLLGKYSELEPNWLVLAADKIEELSKAEIVKCCDCKYFKLLADGSWVNQHRTDGICYALIDYHDSERYCVRPDHFCSYGERKERA